MAKPESVKWTGKNLAEVKKLHKRVAHYPIDPKAEPYPRDASQHPDNLHVDVGDRTLVLAPGDTLVKDTDGHLSVTRK